MVLKSASVKALGVCGSSFSVGSLYPTELNISVTELSCADWQTSRMSLALYPSNIFARIWFFTLGSLFSLHVYVSNKFFLDSKVKNQILAKIFEGYSASDIRDVCQSAQLSSVTEMFNSVGYREPTENEEPQTPRALTLADFRTILARRRPSVSVEMLRAFTKWTDQFGAL